MRIYLPASAGDLAAWIDAGTIPAEAERVAAESDTEDEEYAALMTAADLADPRRRIVVAAEVSQGSRGDGPIAWRHVAAVHADPEPREPGADPDEDLAWFGTQELGQLGI